jgi:Zn-dependent M16 (insulinase) family peptidase
MARRIDAVTGGIGLSTHARTRFDRAGNCLPFISINGKCLTRNRERMFDIFSELLHQADFNDLTRLKNLLLEYRAGLESMVVSNGHRLAISLASRNLSRTRTLNESWNGVHQLQTIKQLAEDLNDDKLAALSTDLRAIRETIFSRRNFKLALIGDELALKDAQASAQSLVSGFGNGNVDGFGAPDISVDNGLIREGWSTSSAVSFVALAFKTVRMEHEDASALSVISKILRSKYLHREIREKGGAYGGFAIYSPEDGLFSFASYRDPHIASTLKVFDNACKFIRMGSFSEEDVNEAILQVCSEIDKPDPPGQAARKAYYRKIIALTDEMRLRFKGRLLSLTRSQVMQVAEKYFDMDESQKAVAVISAEEKLKLANQRLSGKPLQIFRI